jgi:drug/metabolite transporter (DMT)-like permease
MIAASIYQMLRGMIVFVTTIMSIILLGQKYYRHHWIALLILVIGAAIVGASPIIFPDEDQNKEVSSNPVLGLIFVLTGIIFSGLTMIAEEKLFRVYYIHPLQMIGWEGVWGILIYSVILTILQFVPCHNNDICPYGTVEDTIQAFYEMSLNYWTWFLAIGSILSVSLYNTTNVSVTKYASCAQNSTINACRPALVWIFFLIYPGKGHEHFIWLQTIGFAIIIFGTLMYNEIITLPFLSLNINTQDAINARISPKSQYLTSLSFDHDEIHSHH